MAIKRQEKYAIMVKDGDFKGQYGPFDSVESARAIRRVFVKAGLPVTNVYVFWTVSTARSIAAELTKAMTEAAKAAELAEDSDDDDSVESVA